MPTFLIFLMLACFIHLEKIILGPFGFMRLHDVFESVYGDYSGYGSLFLKFGLFLWAPFKAGGHPTFAEQIHPFNPWVFLSIVFPPWLVYTLSLIALLTMAGWGMTLFLSTLMKFSKKLSLFGGILFVLTMAETNDITPTMVFNFSLPLFIVLLYRLENYSSRTRIGLGLFFVFLMAWSNLVITFPFAVAHLFSIAFLVDLSKNERVRNLKKTFWIWTTYGLFFLPVVYALLVYAPEVNRIYTDLKDTSWNTLQSYFFSKFSTLFSSHQWILLFAGMGMFFHLRPQNKTLRKALCSFALWFLLSFLAGFSPFKNLLHGTFFQKMDLQHFSMPFYFFLTVTSVAVLNLVDSNSKAAKSYFGFSALGIGLLFLFSLFPVLTQNIYEFKIELILNLLCFAATYFLVLKKLSLKAKTTQALLCLLLFTGIGCIRFLNLQGEESGRFNQFGNLKDLKSHFDQTKHGRVAFIGIPDSTGHFVGLETLGGTGAIFYKPYADYFHALLKPELAGLSQQQQSVVLKYPYSLRLLISYYLLGERLPQFPHYWAKLPEKIKFDLNLMKSANVTHLVAAEMHPDLKAISSKVTAIGTPEEKKLSLADNPMTDVLANKWSRLSQQKQLFVYELKNSKPRYEILSKSPTPPEITVIRETPDEIRLSVEGSAQLNASQKLHIANNFDRHWRAYINGIPAPIQRQPGSPFQEINLEGVGRKNILIRYEDPVLKAVIYISLIGSLGMLLILLFGTKMKSWKTKPTY